MRKGPEALRGGVLGTATFSLLELGILSRFTEALPLPNRSRPFDFVFLPLTGFLSSLELDASSGRGGGAGGGQFFAQSGMTKGPFRVGASTTVFEEPGCLKTKGFSKSSFEEATTTLVPAVECPDQIVPSAMRRRPPHPVLIRAVGSSKDLDCIDDVDVRLLSSLSRDGDATSPIFRFAGTEEEGPADDDATGLLDELLESVAPPVDTLEL